MRLFDIVQVLFFFAVLGILVRPLGLYMHRVMTGESTWLSRWFGGFERWIYRLARIDPNEEQPWKTYASQFLAFNAVGLLWVYALQRWQSVLPLNPDGQQNVAPSLAWNTAMSFATNTNWQAYGGEKTLSYFTQMLGLTSQNFLSAASGIAVVFALMRGLGAAHRGLGNYGVDMVRSVLYILLPLSCLWAGVLVSQGVVQTWNGAAQVTLLQPIEKEGKRLQTQRIARGPAASQVAIKQLGTNGGGFFNTNSSHPLENPTPLSNFFQLLAILLIPASLCISFGAMVGAPRQGWALLATMTLVFLLALSAAMYSEIGPDAPSQAVGIDQKASALQAGGNMEGKEVRFGITHSVLWLTSTTAASNGSVNSMHDSYRPIGGMVAMLLMLLGEVIFGGVGSGLYGMIAFVVVAVFLAGLMVGRTPEYLNKKIEPFEMKMVALAILLPSASVLLGAAIAAMLPEGKAALNNSGAHGFSELLYAFASAGNNNGSAFAGFSADQSWLNTLLGLAMGVGRYGVAIPMLALAGSMQHKRTIPASLGTLPTDTGLFVLFLALVIVLVGALTFFPALALGPLAELFSTV